MARKKVKYLQRKRRAHCVREGAVIGVGASASSGGIAFELTAQPAGLPAISLEVSETDVAVVANSPALREIEALTEEAEKRWQRKLVVSNELTRSLVSFQANKSRAVYRVQRQEIGYCAKIEYGGTGPRRPCRQRLKLIAVESR
jgi:hypothetical protein